MRWYKAANNITSDSALHLIAAKTKCYRHEVIALWILLLEKASHENNKGNLGSIDFEEIDFHLDFLNGKSEKIYKAFEEKGKIKDNQLVKWQEHQIDNTAAERQRKSRLKKIGGEAILERDNYKCCYCGKDEDYGIDHILPLSKGGDNSPNNLATCCKKCNTIKNSRTPEEANMPLLFEPIKSIWGVCHSDKRKATLITLEENRIDKIIDDDDSASFAKISIEIQKLMKGRILNTQLVHAWIKAGADENLIIETLKVCLNKKGGEPPNSLKYFEGAIIEAIRQKNEIIEVKNGIKQDNRQNGIQKYGKRSLTDIANEIYAQIDAGTF